MLKLFPRFIGALVLVASLIALAACGGGGGAAGGGSTVGSGGAPVTINPAMAFYLDQAGGQNGGAFLNWINVFTPDQVLTGELTATNVVTSETETFAWSIYLNEATLEVQSNKTIILDPGTYDFALLVQKGDHQYTGEALLVDIADGENDVPLTIRPIIGDVTQDVTVVERLVDLRFQYLATELVVLVDPRMGIMVDGGPEQIFAINPGTGLSEYMMLNLQPGQHTLQLKLYDGGLQRGKSLTSQELQLLAPGVDVAMDLVALHGETIFSLDVAGGDATFNFNIPAEIVDEAGGTANLDVLLRVVSDETQLQFEELLNLSPNGPDYAAQTVLSGFQFEMIGLSLIFTDNVTGDELGWCMTVALLSSDPQTKLCQVILRRRAVINGNLLATLGVNVWTPGWEPVGGAMVGVDGIPSGITGSGGFGTPGYLKLLLIAGDHHLRAEFGDFYGTADVTLDPLGVHNVDIILDTMIDGDQDGFPPSQDCDDANATVYPGAPGTGMDIDNNCDGVVDGDEVAFQPSVCGPNGETCDQLGWAFFHEPSGMWWAHASPCSGSCSVATPQNFCPGDGCGWMEPKDVPGLAHPWGAETWDPLVDRPLWPVGWQGNGNGGWPYPDQAAEAQSWFEVNQRCAAVAFDPTFNHCDYQDPVVDGLNRGWQGWWDMWFVHAP